MRTFLTAVVAALALAASIGTGRAQPPLPFPFSCTFSFPTGGSTTNFPDPSWIYWYNLPGGNSPMTDDVSMDYVNNTNSGCLIYSVPFANASNTQDVIYGTFNNLFPFFADSANLTESSNISFWIRADPSTAPRKVGGINVDYGTISTGFFFPYSFEAEGSVTIPMSASNNWVQLNVPINPSSPVLTGIAGVAFSIATFGSSGGVPNYPALQISIFYLDQVQITAATEPPTPPSFSRPYKPVSGFNAIATSFGSGGQIFNREQIVTAADTGYTFFNQANPTYSWNIKSFPSFSSNAWQAHFFIVDGAPGQFDQPADYNLADVLWFTVGSANATNPAAGASFNFRLKTNEPGGNGMLFNTISPTDTVNNPDGWPIEPIATLTDPNGALGTWDVKITGNTSITVTSPSGLSTNFSITPAQAALFADPVTLILGGQPNNQAGEGQAVVYSSFNAIGVASPIADNFLADSSFNTSIWKTSVANDTNGVVLVPTNAAFWVPWSLPDAGFVLQTKGNLGAAGGWTQPGSLVIRNGSFAAGGLQGADEALVLSNQLADPMQGYFRLVQYHASMLQVLFAGETNSPIDDAPQRFTPNTSLGFTGTASPISGALTPSGAVATVTVNAVDSNFNIVTSVTDTVTLTSSGDPNTIEPLPAALVNGTLTEQVIFNAVGNWTVTATDISDPTIAAGISSPIMVNP